MGKLIPALRRRRLRPRVVPLAEKGRITGRPRQGPTGAQGQTMAVRSLPHRTLHLERLTWKRLDALCGVLNRPQWAVVGDALARFMDALPDAARDAVEREVKRGD